VQRLASAQVVSSWFRFEARPRKRSFTKPNWSLIVAKTCSTCDRVLLLIRFDLPQQTLPSLQMDLLLGRHGEKF